MKAITSVKEKLSTAESVRSITEWLAGNKDGTRTGLAREMCERLGLRDGKGALQMASALKALRDLEAEGRWKLPAALSRGCGKWVPRQLDHAVPEAQGVPQRAELIEGLELIEVRSEDDAVSDPEKRAVRKPCLARAVLIEQPVKPGCAQSEAERHQSWCRRSSSSGVGNGKKITPVWSPM